MRATPLKKLRRNRPENSVFLNLAYDAEFANQFLAYVCGICAFGMAPRVTLEIPGGSRRLDRICSLIEDCQYSIHDLSWVVLDDSPVPVPRFNMPFELGLAVRHAMSSGSEHTWYVFESTPWRLQRSLSDLNGTDAYIHDNSVDGILRELAKAFVRRRRQPTVARMRLVYDTCLVQLPEILQQAAASSLFNARALQEIVIFASELANQL